MNRIILTLAICCLSSKAYCFPAPRDWEAGYKEKLVGVWVEVDEGNEFTFNAEGEFMGVYPGLTAISGTYTLHRDKLSMLWKASDGTQKRGTFVIGSLSENRLALLNELNGQIVFRVFKRKPRLRD